MTGHIGGVHANLKRDKWRVFLTIQDRKIKYRVDFKTDWYDNRMEAVALRDAIVQSQIREYFEYATRDWKEKDDYHTEIIVSHQSNATQDVYECLRAQGEGDMVQFSREDLLNELDIPGRTYRDAIAKLEYMQVCKIKVLAGSWFVYFA